MLTFNFDVGKNCLLGVLSTLVQFALLMFEHAPPCD